MVLLCTYNLTLYPNCLFSAILRSWVSVIPFLLNNCFGKKNAFLLIRRCCFQYLLATVKNSNRGKTMHSGGLWSDNMNV